MEDQAKQDALVRAAAQRLLEAGFREECYVMLRTGFQMQRDAIDQLLTDTMIDQQAAALRDAMLDFGATLHQWQMRVPSASTRELALYGMGVQLAKALQAKEVLHALKVLTEQLDG